MSFNLLIVDDSELVRASLRKLIVFTADVSAIREVGTLGEALVDVQRHCPTLVILDLNLPDGFGTDFIQRFKELSPTSRIAIFTIHADPECRDYCLAAGAEWFFNKVTDQGSLLDVVRQLAKSTAATYPNLGNTHE